MKMLWGKKKHFQDLYSTFIDISKLDDSLTRLKALKRLMRRLPDVNFATMRFVCRHLTKIVANSDVNKMEVKNLAIVFGPTLVRASEDNMMSMITDMGQQCRIIESVLSNCDWFFSNDDAGDLKVGFIHFFILMQFCIR